MSEQLQEFEKHPYLARIVEWMANNVQMPGTKWNELLREINTALSKSEPQDPRLFVAENEKEMKRLYDWIMDENRRKAGSFFTEGWTRNVAKEIEYRLTQNK